MEKPTSPTDFASAVGISIPYASQLLNGSRPWPRKIALTAYRKLGVKLGPIADATDEEIAVLERFEPSALQSTTPSEKAA